MYLREAADELLELAAGSVNRRTTIPRVNELLFKFTVANTTGNGYVSGRIVEVRMWFKELAKEGRSHYSYEARRSFAFQSISKLKSLISDDGPLGT